MGPQDGDVLLVADPGSSAVYRVDLGSGQLLDTVADTSMHSLRRLAVDSQGNMYVTCRDDHCVQVIFFNFYF
jgi:hypothetical protein